MDKKSFGKLGEDMAAEFLTGEGYKILERNWRFKHIEVDLIALDDNQLVIVEVKTRSGNYYGEPSTAVDYRKQNFLIYAAERYLFGNKLDIEVRFDIISIIISQGNTDIEHIKEAFHPVAR